MPYPTKKLGEVIEINYGKGLSKDDRVDSGKYFAYGSNGPVYRTNESLTSGEIIVIGRKGTAGALYFISEPCWPIDTTFFAKPKNGASLKFIYYLLQIKRLARLAIVTGVPGINRTTLANISIQLPPLETQKQIVERLDKIVAAQKLNDELIQKTGELFQSLLHKELNPAGKDWGVKKLGEVCDITRGSSPRPINRYLTKSPDGMNWIKIGDVREGEKYITSTAEKIKLEGVSKTRLVQEGDLILSNSMSFGRPYILKISGAIHDGWLLLHIKDTNELLQDFLYYTLGITQTKIQFEKAASGGVVRNLNSDLVRRVRISLPPLETQKQIAAKLSAVQDYKTQLLTQCAKLKELFESVLHKSMETQSPH